MPSGRFKGVATWKRDRALQRFDHSKEMEGESREPNVQTGVIPPPILICFLPIRAHPRPSVVKIVFENLPLFFVDFNFRK